MRELAKIPLAPPGGFRGFGNLGLEKLSPSDAPLIFNQFISLVIGLMSIIAFIWFILLLFMGAIALITSGGDKAKVAEAKGRLTTGLIGVIIVIAAVFIADFIGSLLGIDILGGALLLEKLF